jgi:hypothetical protein
MNMDGEREEKRQREGRTNDTCDDEPTTKEREEGVETSDRGIGRRRKMVEERTAYGINKTMSVEENTQAPLPWDARVHSTTDDHEFVSRSFPSNEG